MVDRDRFLLLPAVRVEPCQPRAGWENACGKPLTDVFPDRAGQVAACRLLRNPRVSVEDIPQPDREALAERSRLHSTVLAQDTTALSYTSLRGSTTGLSSLGARGSGLWAHAEVAFSESGRPLGVVGLGLWVRPTKCKKQAAKSEKRERSFRDFEQAAELGRACAETRVIAVCDSEADIWALFNRQARVAGEAGLLTRSNRDRERQAHPVSSSGRWRALRQCVRPAKPRVKGRKVVIRDRRGPEEAHRPHGGEEGASASSPRASRDSQRDSRQRPECLPSAPPLPRAYQAPLQADHLRTACGALIPVTDSGTRASVDEPPQAGSAFSRTTVNPGQFSSPRSRGSKWQILVVVRQGPASPGHVCLMSTLKRSQPSKSTLTAPQKVGFNSLLQTGARILSQGLSQECTCSPSRERTPVLAFLTLSSIPKLP